jgi:hypothetical protein
MTASLSFQKPKRLIEEVEKDPLCVIKKVFAEIDRDFLREILHKWLCHALTIYQPPYKTIEQQLQLLFFHDQLINLIEGLYFIVEKNPPEQEFLNQLRAELEKYPPCNQIISEIKDETLVVKRFYRVFTIEYVRSELWDWLVTAILYDEQRPEGLKVEAIIWVYEWVQYLTEAAFQMIQK